MSTVTFDTLTTARELEAAGIERRQAEAHAEALRRAVSADRDEFATKADLAGVRDELRAALAALEARLTWRLVGIAAAIVAAVKLIPGLD